VGNKARRQGEVLNQWKGKPRNGRGLEGSVPLCPPEKRIKDGEGKNSD